MCRATPGRGADAAGPRRCTHDPACAKLASMRAARIVSLIALALAALVLAAACGGGDDEEAAPATTEEAAATTEEAAATEEAATTEEAAAAGDAAAGATVFADAGCGSCHTLSAAGTSGTVGPNLDDSQPSFDLVVERVTNGKSPMPAFGQDGTLDEQQILDVAAYVVESTQG